MLEKRVEEASQDNAQLREELSSLKRHYERLKAQYEGGGRRGSVGSGSPQTSPARARQQDRVGEELKAKMGSLSETVRYRVITVGYRCVLNIPCCVCTRNLWFVRPIDCNVQHHIFQSINFPYTQH